MLPVNVLITGGSRGIGAASAQRFAQRGWNVGVAYRSEAQRASEVVRAVDELGQRAVAIRVDVSVEDDVIAMFEQVERLLGPIDALVNSAGIVAPRSSVEEISAERLERMMAVNVVGSFLCAREAVRRMSPRHGGAGGSIVNVSSGVARLGSPREMVDYAASKAAVEALTIGLAKEVGADGIRVNAVRPGIMTRRSTIGVASLTRWPGSRRQSHWPAPALPERLPRRSRGCAVTRRRTSPAPSST